MEITKFQYRGIVCTGVLFAARTKARTRRHYFWAPPQGDAPELLVLLGASPKYLPPESLSETRRKALVWFLGGKPTSVKNPNFQNKYQKVVASL
jgi:hypothetical protein